MKKLILVALLLIAVLLLSWWAKNSNFSLFTMMQSVQHPKSATQSAMRAFPTTAAPTTIPVEILITITPNGFVPDVIMITTNTKITWVNKSGVSAGIASDPQDAYAPLNIGDVNQNGSSSVVFTKPGRYHYLNTKNPLQKGTLVVR